MFKVKTQKGGREGQKLLLLPPSRAALSLQLKTSVYFFCESIWHCWILLHSLAYSIISWEPKPKNKHFWRKQLNKFIVSIISNSFRQKVQATEIIWLGCRCWKCHFWIFPSRRDFVFQRGKCFSKYFLGLSRLQTF